MLIIGLIVTQVGKLNGSQRNPTQIGARWIVRKNIKKKSHKTADPTWDAETYGSDKNVFDLEYIKHYNEAEGKTQIIILHKSKEDGRIVKYTIL